MRSFVLMLFILLVSALPAIAAIIHVPADESTIQDGIWAAQVGDTVQLAPGTYTEGAQLREGVLLRGNPLDPASVRIDASNEYFAFLGLASSEYPPAGIEGISISGAMSNAIVVSDFKLAVRYCRFVGNGQFESAFSGGAISCTISPHLSVEYCVFSGNQSERGGAIFIAAADYSENAGIENCTFFANQAQYGAGIAVEGPLNISLRKSILAFNEGGGAVFGMPYDAVVTQCDSYANVGGDELDGSGGGNFSADPLFCDAGLGDFRLHEDSPCLPENNDGVLVGACGEGDCEAPICETLFVPQDYPTLSEALAHAYACDTVLVAPGTYYENIRLRTGVVLVSSHGYASTIIDGQSSGSTVTLGFDRDEPRNPQAAVIEGFTIRGGSESGLSIWDIDAEVRDCWITGNSSSDAGGGIFARDCDPVISNCLVSGNLAVDGGGIYLRNSDATIIGTSVVGNEAVNGSGILNHISSAPSIENCLVAFNLIGAGLLCYSPHLTISCSDVYGNTGGDELCGNDAGGNISVDPLLCDWAAGDFTLYETSPCLPENNSCGVQMGAGGLGDCEAPECDLLRVPQDYPSIRAALAVAGICDTVLVEPGVYPGSLSLPTGVALISTGGAQVTTIIGDGDGPAIDIGLSAGSAREGETSTLEGFTVSGGSASGISVRYEDATIRACIIEGNTTDENGGGIRCLHASPIVEDCIIRENVAQSYGGGLFLGAYSSPILLRCVLGENTAEKGSALFVTGSSYPLVQSCTLVENLATSGEGTVYSQDLSTPIIQRSVIAFNDGGQALHCGEDGSYNVSCSDIFGNMGGDELCGIDSGGNFSANPHFCDLGGDDYRVSPDSPCLPENNACGELVGALGSGDCSPVGCRVLRVPEEFANIGDALDQAGYCDSVLVGPGVYQESLVLPVGVHLVGCGPELTILEGDGESAVLDIGGREGASPDSSATYLAGFTIRGGGDSGLVIRRSAPFVEDCIIRDNSSPGRGGGVKLWMAQPTFVDCMIESNFAYESGGGLWMDSSTPRFDRCDIRGNQSDGSGGGIHAVETSIIFSDSRIEGNSAWRGGGLYADGDISILPDVIVTGNTAIENGGGLYLELHVNRELEGLVITDNFAAGEGGGIYIHASSMSGNVFRDCLIAENEASTGGGMVIDHGALSLEGCTFAANRAPGGSNLWLTPGSNPHLDRCIVAFGELGQGIHCEMLSSVDADCCNVFGNEGGDEICLGEGAGNFSEDPRFCDPENSDYSLAAGSPCLPDGNSCGVLVGAFGEGCELPVDGPELPIYRTSLHAFPNPFNPSTEIRFVLERPGVVNLAIYDIVGRRVRNLIPGRTLDAGAHVLVWDGREDSGRSSSSGVYLVTLRNEEKLLQQKLVMIK